MKIIKGDLITLALNGNFDVIIHGCNCFCKMGAGIAKAIRHEFPEAYKADLATQKGENKLGTYTEAQVERNGYNFSVINAYTQFDYRGNGIKIDYDAIRQIFQKLKLYYSGKRFGLPKIGAGLAGGNWESIKEIIEEELNGEDVTLVELK